MFCCRIRLNTICLGWLLFLLSSVAARGDIFRWDNGQLIPGTVGIVPGPRVQLDHRELQFAYLSDLDLADSRFDFANLTDAFLHYSTLTNANLTGTKLAGASLDYATLTSVNLSDAVVTGTSFAGTTSLGFSKEQLYSTASYKTKNLGPIRVFQNDLSGWSFAGQDLSGAEFANYVGGEAMPPSANLTGANLNAANLAGAKLGRANLTHADFTDALVNGASLWFVTPTGFSKEQLYSTASYRDRELRRIELSSNDLSGWSFAAQNLASAFLNHSNLKNADLGEANLTNASLRQSNLTNAHFQSATLTSADLSYADTRGAAQLNAVGAITRNMIWPDGSIKGLEVDSGAGLLVRDDDGVADNPTNPYWLSPRPPIRITVQNQLTVARGYEIRLLFDADPWNSTISFELGVPVTLGGSLELSFAGNVDVASQLGRTLDVFDWTGVNPTGRFEIDSPYVWDLSHLYTTGEVTLTAIPEPMTAALVGTCLLVTACGLLIRVRRRT